MVGNRKLLSRICWWCSSNTSISIDKRTRRTEWLMRWRWDWEIPAENRVLKWYPEISDRAVRQSLPKCCVIVQVWIVINWVLLLLLQKLCKMPLIAYLWVAMVISQRIVFCCVACWLVEVVVERLVLSTWFCGPSLKQFLVMGRCKHKRLRTRQPDRFRDAPCTAQRQQVAKRFLSADSAFACYGWNQESLGM